jgi:hypothetical protein
MYEYIIIYLHFMFEGLKNASNIDNEYYTVKNSYFYCYFWSFTKFYFVIKTNTDLIFISDYKGS